MKFIGIVYEISVSSAQQTRRVSIVEGHPWFKRWGTSLSLRRPGYGPRTVGVGWALNTVGQSMLWTVSVGFVLDSVGQVLLRAVSVGSVLDSAGQSTLWIVSVGFVLDSVGQGLLWTVSVGFVLGSVGQRLFEYFGLHYHTSSKTDAV